MEIVVVVVLMIALHKSGVFLKTFPFSTIYRSLHVHVHRKYTIARKASHISCIYKYIASTLMKRFKCMAGELGLYSSLSICIEKNINILSSYTHSVQIEYISLDTLDTQRMLLLLLLLFVRNETSKQASKQASNPVDRLFCIIPTTLLVVALCVVNGITHSQCS